MLRLRRPITLVILAIFASSCERHVEEPLTDFPEPQGTAGLTRPEASIRVPADGRIRWFEFTQGETQGGLFQTTDPENSSLLPLVPWVSARRITGAVAFPGSIVFSVNRSGFIAAESAADGNLSLYYIDASELAAPFSMGPPIRFGSLAAVPLYRDGFFSPPQGLPPVFPMLALDLKNLSSRGIAPEAVAPIGTGEGWELDALEVGGDGRWLFRIRKPASGEAVFYASPSLSEPPQPSSQAEFHRGRYPLSPQGAPGPLRAILNLWASVNSVVVSTVDVSQEGRRFFLVSSDTLGGREESLALPRVSVAYAYVEDNRAWSVLSDGRGLYSFGSDTPIGFSLPVLPQGFAYTGLAVSGNHLLVSWEEQDSWAVGSAGLLIFPIPND